MNANEFLMIDRTRVFVPEDREWRIAVFNALIGAALFWAAQYCVMLDHPVALGWAGMAGTVLFLHFGTFHLLSCAWRAAGVKARPLMMRPTHSTSLAEFWGRRWNTAFRDVAHRFLFRPLAAQIGATPALVVGFVFSGLVHDLAISVPAGGGYGSPTTYFCVQALGIFVERSAIGRAIGLGCGWRGWLFTAAVLLLPVRWLFHDPFVLRVVVPFMVAMGAA
jgi:hypothetical protein